MSVSACVYESVCLCMCECTCMCEFECVWGGVVELVGFPVSQSA